MLGLCQWGLLHHWVQSVASIDGDMVALLQHLLVRLLPLLNLPLPLVGGPAHVDELLVALVCDDGVPDLLPSPRQDLLLNLLRTLRVGDSSVELRVPDLLLVAREPSADEDEEGKIHDETSEDGEDEADTEDETEKDILQGWPGDAE